MNSIITIKTPDEARALMRRAIVIEDAPILAPHVRQAATDALEEAFAIVRGSAGIDMNVAERFLTTMMVRDLLTLDDVASFTKQMHPPAEDVQRTA